LEDGEKAGVELGGKKIHRLGFDCI